MIPGLLAAIAVFSYLLGGLNGAIIASKYVFHRDVRDYGSGNAGLTNFFRTFGAPGLAIVIGTDVLKTVIAVVAGGLIMGTQGAASTGQVFAGFCVMLGHIYPVFYGFRGGKGVVTAAAMILLLDWRVFLICFAFFALVFAWKKTVSLASICGCLLYPIVTFFITFFIDYKIGGLPGFYVAMATAVAALIGATVIVKHRANIKRILAGEEKPISFKKES